MYSELGPTKVAGPPVRAIRTKPVPAFEMERIVDLNGRRITDMLMLVFTRTAKLYTQRSPLKKKQHDLLTHWR